MSDASEFSPRRDGHDERDHQLIRAAIRTLSRHLSQRKLERLLGLSQGYLSRIASGAGKASRPLNHPNREVIQKVREQFPRLIRR